MGKMFRLTRGLKYTFLLLAGVVTLITPLVVVVEGVGIIYALVWSAFLSIGAAASLYGTVRKNWTGEYIGLPAVTSSLLFLALILFVVAFSAPGSTLTIARVVFGLLFLGFTFSTSARWGDVKFQKRLADYENRKKNGKPGL